METVGNRRAAVELTIAEIGRRDDGTPILLCLGNVLVSMNLRTSRKVVAMYFYPVSAEVGFLLLGQDSRLSMYSMKTFKNWINKRMARRWDATGRKALRL